MPDTTGQTQPLTSLVHRPAAGTCASGATSVATAMVGAFRDQEDA